MPEAEDLFFMLQQLRTSEGLEAMLEQVGATLAPGKQQALQVSRDHGKHAPEDGSGAGAPVRVSVFTHSRLCHAQQCLP